MLISWSRTAEGRLWEPAIHGSSKMMRFKPRINQSLVRVNVHRIFILIKSIFYMCVISMFFKLFSSAKYEDRASPYFQMIPGQETSWGKPPPILKSLQFA